MWFQDHSVVSSPSRQPGPPRDESYERERRVSEAMCAAQGQEEPAESGGVGGTADSGRGSPTADPQTTTRPKQRSTNKKQRIVRRTRPTVEVQQAAVDGPAAAGGSTASAAAITNSNYDTIEQRSTDSPSSFRELLEAWSPANTSLVRTSEAQAQNDWEKCRGFSGWNNSSNSKETMKRELQTFATGHVHVAPVEGRTNASRCCTRAGIGSRREPRSFVFRHSSSVRDHIQQYRKFWCINLTPSSLVVEEESGGPNRQEGERGEEEEEEEREGGMKLSVSTKIAAQRAREHILHELASRLGISGAVQAHVMQQQAVKAALSLRPTAPSIISKKQKRTVDLMVSATGHGGKAMDNSTDNSPIDMSPTSSHEKRTELPLLPQSSAAAIEKAKSGSTISLTKYLRISSRGGNRSRMTKMLEPVPTPDCGEDTESQDFNTSLEQEQEQEDQQDNSATIPQILGGSRDGRPEMNQNDSVDHEVHFVEWLSAIRDKPTKADQRIAIISRTAQSLGLQSRYGSWKRGIQPVDGEPHASEEDNLYSTLQTESRPVTKQSTRNRGQSRPHTEAGRQRDRRTDSQRNKASRPATRAEDTRLRPKKQMPDKKETHASNTTPLYAPEFPGKQTSHQYSILLAMKLRKSRTVSKLIPRHPVPPLDEKDELLRIS